MMAMSNTVIEVKDLGKKYQIKSQTREGYSSFRDVITNQVKNIGQKLLSLNGKNITPPTTVTEDFWALKDVSFNVEHGEVIGIIGRNGAGKSTLLKLLSRITEPTIGSIEISGRISSLLEVGTGFHAELTGRENIFLNGAILGMKRAEIKQKFDEIVAFAEIERFLDTPVKRYSSGMTVRLAFSVAAHLEPEILLIDEVLAVGDAAFQKKCIGKMGDVAKGGRTILFVSHSMDVIRRLCQSVVLLADGKICMQGETNKVVDYYLSGVDLKSEMKDRGPDPTQPMRLRRVRLLNKQGKNCNHFTRDDVAQVEIFYDINSPIHNVHVVCHVVDVEERIIVSTGDCDIGQDLYTKRIPGSYMAAFNLPVNLLNDGDYSLIFALGVPYGNTYDRIVNVVRFSLSDSRKSGGPKYLQRRPGFLVKEVPWSTHKVG